MSCFKHVCGCGNTTFEVHYDIEIGGELGFILKCTKCDAQYYFELRPSIIIEQVQGVEFEKLLKNDTCIYCGATSKKGD